MILVLLLLLLGIGLSAFFSGCETGFYRVTRVRLVMDAKSGGWISRAMLWLVNRTSVVVATVLIGNNIANYLVSLGILLATQRLLDGWDEVLQTFVPVIMTPVLFIYGELLPKYVFYQVPYRLLRSSAPVMLFFALLFLPVSILVLAFEALWNRLTGKSVTEVNKTLERQDLQRALKEGQEAGVVQPIQREITQNLFTFGVRPVRQFAVPLRAIPLVDANAPREVILDRAERAGQKLVGILRQGKLAGCYQVVDLLFSTNPTLPVTPTCEVLATDSNINVLTRMQGQQCPLAAVVDSTGRHIGVVHRERLSGLMVGKL
jgi:putative hemolysin